MASLNKVMLIGNVTRDPEVRYLDQNSQSGAKVANFGLALNERYKDRNGETRETTEFVNVVAWRSNADVVERYVHRGSQIYVEGRLRTREYTDASGNRKSRTEVQVDNLQLLGRRPDSDYQSEGQGAPQYRQQQSGGYYQQQPRQAAPQYHAPVQQAPAQPPVEDDLPNDDLPF